MFPYLQRLQYFLSDVTDVTGESGKRLIKPENGRIVYNQDWYNQLDQPARLELEQELGIKNNTPDPSTSAVCSSPAISEEKSKSKSK